jgi:hypothetical protein
MHDRTDHARLAELQASRDREDYLAIRTRETALFEAKARGDIPHHKHPIRTAPAASVAIHGATTMNMHTATSLLQPAVSSSAFLKAGVLGFQGGGKTLTSALTLIGLYKHTLQLGLHDGAKPVAMFDTEKGSDWLIPIFKKAGVPFAVAKRQAFADLLNVMDDAENSAFGLLIDSITHPWRELVESYLRKKERSYLAMDDWGYLKGEHGWKKFTDRFVNSKLHIVMAGRAGYEYENYLEDGRKKMEKVGTKMKTEGETGYEPDLLILMEQVEDLRTNKVVHRATVQKDRSTLLDGQTFDLASYDDEGNALPVDVMVQQTFGAFLPHVQCLALGSPHVGIGSTGDSQHILKIERRDWTPVQREICIDEIQTLLAMHYPSQTADDKKARLTLMLKHFNATWTEIEKVMPLPDLRAGYDSLHLEIEKKPSRYGAAIAADAAPADINDSLPEGMAPLAAVTAAVTEKLVAEPAATDAFDEPKWLADLTRAFDQCVDFASFGEKQQALMAPAKEKVTPAAWKRAVKLASACAAQLLEKPSSAFETAVQ